MMKQPSVPAVLVAEPVGTKVSSPKQPKSKSRVGLGTGHECRVGDWYEGRAGAWAWGRSGDWS